VQKIVRKLFSALAYLHDHNIAHRDLKPENIIFDRMEEGAEPKILDFGAAYQYDEGVTSAVINEEAGTLGYKSPEMILGNACSLKVDCWSMGVISYIMLCGFPPFFSDPTDKDNDDQLVNAPFWFFFNSVSKDLKDQILSASYSFPEKYWSEISAEAKHFVSSLLQVDAEVRLSAKQALQHKWFGVPSLQLPTTRVLSTQAILHKRLTSTNLLLEKDGRRIELVDSPAGDPEGTRRLTLRAAQRKWTSGLVDTVSFAVPGGIQDFSDSTQYFRITPRHPRLHVNQISFQPPDPRKIEGSERSDGSESLPASHAGEMPRKDPRKIKRDLHLMEGENEGGSLSMSKRKERREKRKSKKEPYKQEESEGVKKPSADESAPRRIIEKSSGTPSSKEVAVGSVSPRLKVGSDSKSPRKKKLDTPDMKLKEEKSDRADDNKAAERNPVNVESIRLDERKEEEIRGRSEELDGGDSGKKREKPEKKKKTILSSPFKKKG
jgi:serine/threonine protein kinase